MRGLEAFFYRAADGWRWQLIASNGRIIGASTEAYTQRVAALRNFRQVTQRNVPAIPRKGCELWREVAP